MGDKLEKKRQIGIGNLKVTKDLGILTNEKFKTKLKLIIKSLHPHP
jgi:hypothetical protein